MLILKIKWKFGWYSWFYQARKKFDAKQIVVLSSSMKLGPGGSIKMVDEKCMVLVLTDSADDSSVTDIARPAINMQLALMV